MTQDSDSEISAQFDAAAESVREARRFVADTLEQWGAGGGSADAALLTSELATNAVIHAQSRYTITVLRLAGGRIRVVVADSSSVTAHRRHYSPMSGTGRGLGMVADLAAAWGMETTDLGKIVWFELTATPAPPATGARTADRRDAGASAADVDVDLDALLADLGGWDESTEPDPGDPPRGAALLVTSGGNR